MSGNEELQRLNMVEALPRLLTNGDATCIDKMFPRLQQAIPGDGAEFHMIASNTFRTILVQKLVPPSTFTQTFLSSIVACVDSRDPYTSKAWLETLLDIIDLLPQNVVKSDILPVAVSRGQLSQSIYSRVTSCELLGRIATKFDCTQIQKEIVPLVHSLCQDVSGEVRGSMCYQLPFIARGLSLDAVEPALLPLLVELAVDEEQYVQLASVHTISDLVNVLPGDILKNTIVPLLKKLCDQAIVGEDKVLCAISEKYGQLCIGLKSVLSESEMSWFISFFQEIANLGIGKQPPFHEIKNVSDLVREKEHADLLLQCRLNCAYNFPGIAHFAGHSMFEEMLHSTYTNLACDHSFYVRRLIAGGFHEVFRVLGKRCLLLKPELFMLLSDESRDVLQSLVPNLSSIIEHLNKNGIISSSPMDPFLVELLRNLLKCEVSLSVSNDWRLHSAMLSQLECCAKTLPSDLIYTNIPVVLFHRIQDSRALPCRLAAARLLLVVLRHTSKIENQNEIRNRIFTELCIHHSCHTRLLFVKMCGMALDIFSSSYIKEHFFLRLLSLAGDPVPNVRLVLCGLLPRLKALLKLPHDSNLLSALQETIERLQSYPRRDKDVLDKLHAACKEMEALLNGSVHESNDADDLALYQEEQQIEMRNVSTEPRRLVTVNMKTLGEGKRATLVSLRGPDLPRIELRQRNLLPSGSNSSVSSSVAVSSVGLLGGHIGNESRITASITSTTSETAPSFSGFSPQKNQSDSNFSSITLVGNNPTNYRALTQIKKDPSSSNFSSFTSINKKVSSTSTTKSWNQPLTYGSRLPLPVSSKTNKSQPKNSLKQSISVSDVSDFHLTAVYVLMSRINSDSKMFSISGTNNGGTSPPQQSPTSSSASSPALLSSSYPALLEEEFYIDAGIPLPEKLTVSKMSTESLVSSDSASKIPSLRELLFQNSTLLAQVANRTAVTENAAKSLSYAKSFNASKIEQSAGSSLSSTSVNKRFSRIFEENASDFRYSSLISRPSTIPRKDSAGSSLLPKPTALRASNSDSDGPSNSSKEGAHYASKMVSSSSPRTNSNRKDSKIGMVNRRSMIYYPNQASETDGSIEIDRNTVGPLKNGKADTSTQVNQYSSHDAYTGTTDKIGNSSSSKFSSGAPGVSVRQNTRGGSTRSSLPSTKLLSSKTPSVDPPNRRYSSLDSGYATKKEKDHLKTNPGQPSNKRYSLGDKTPTSNGSFDKKVSLSSIGVKGARRSYNPGQRPQSCFILPQQNDKPNGSSSRSMSQESLGIEQNRSGTRIMKRTPAGYGRSENRQSRIPRGGTSCHSSPGNSRPSSPVHGPTSYVTVSHTAPSSARVSRSSSPTDGLPSRVSLASIKLHEPSRLPIRKYNHHL